MSRIIADTTTTARGRPARAASWARALTLSMALAASTAAARAQAPGEAAPGPTPPATAIPAAPVDAPTPTPIDGVPPGTTAVAPGVPDAGPGTAFVGEPGVGGALDGPVVVQAGLPPEIQVVRFQGPEGVKVEVLGPPPEAAPQGDGHGLGTFGLRVGVGYQLRITGIPNREGVELFPVIEVVGHLHRPNTVDPGKYPIRVQLEETDFVDVLAGRLVTQVIYLEDPDQALPMHLPKDQIPVVPIGPAEDPLKVASALGRPMAILRLGGRAPTANDLAGAPFYPLPAVACPFAGPVGGRCGLPCGPARGTPPPPGRSWVPADEFLCDGGDHGNAAAFGGDGSLRGIDPRDAVMRFNDDRRPRVLPTNTVCLYAPRFAAVRNAIGANQALTIEVAAGHEVVTREEQSAAAQGPRRMTQNTAAEINRARERASEVAVKAGPNTFSELRVLAGVDTLSRVHGRAAVAIPMSERGRAKAVGQQRNVRPQGIKTATAPVVTGVVSGANEAVMAWKPQETVGVEVPPNKPGMAVVKQVDKSEAEPGDVVTFTIRFRNMGNVPIRSVSVLDSLLPRLEYVPNTAEGPKGTVFTAAPNAAGSTELRWDLPEPLAPGAHGYVSFQAKVR